MKKLIGILICLGLLAGCAGLGKPTTSVCDGVEGSYICDTFKDVGIRVEDVNLIFKIANLEAIKHDLYKKEACMDFLNSSEALLSHSISYANFANYVLGKISSINTDFSIELVIVGEYFGMFQQPLPINEFDRDLILRHISEQRQIVAMLGG